MNVLMPLDTHEMLKRCSQIADEADLDVCIWYPNNDDATPVEAAKHRGEVLSKLKKLNAIFPPGGDPGEFPAKEFLERASLTAQEVKKTHPNVEMWPSAQKPKNMENWGDEFIECLELLPSDIDGVITGPNEAMDIDTLRRKLPMQYPIRYYNDITHNVRCTLPVNFPLDDWHFAFAATMGRESINPRPVEFKKIHKYLSGYVVGSVSYSEGVNDDINKMIWGWLDYDPSTTVTEILEDYSRLFFVGANPQKVANGILALEKNWIGDPAENPHIESTMQIWKEILEETPNLIENWRFLACMFRAKGDLIVRLRRIFDLSLCQKAERLMRLGKTEQALSVLKTKSTNKYKQLKVELHKIAKSLFDTIGLQLSVEEFHAHGIERGAVLDTIDSPITNKEHYIAKLEEYMTFPSEKRAEATKELEAHFKVKKEEYMFSVAVDTMACFGGKPLYSYLNFRGDIDNKENNPVSLISAYDSMEFKGALSGFLPGCDYTLKIVFLKPRKWPEDYCFSINVDGKKIFSGALCDKNDIDYDSKWLSEKYFSANFDIPADLFTNGCVELEFYEKKYGIEFVEFRITKKIN